MKSFLLTILALLISTSCYAGGVLMMGAPIFEEANECVGYTVCQNLETPTIGWDNSESWTPIGSPTTVIPNYTATQLRGSQSLYVCGEAGSGLGGRYHAIINASTAHIFTRIYMASAPTDDADIIQIRDSADVILARITWRPFFPRLAANHGTAGITWTTNVTNATEYFIWMDYLAGTGANGVLDVYISTTPSKPESATISINNGSSTGNADRYVVGFAYSGCMVFDEMLADDAVIGVIP